jgi:uncharacterized membrane protein
MNICTYISEINWLTVTTVTIISFPLGALWHSKKLFGKAWAEDAKSSVDKNNKAAMFRLFSLSALFHFITVVGLAVTIGKDATLLLGLMTGFLISFAWIFTTIGVTYLFVGRPFRLILIDAGFYLVFFSFAGMLLGAW